MSNFGIGLGSFVAGFERGVGLMQDHRDREEARIDREEARKDRELDRQDRATRRQREAEEYDYQREQRDRDREIRQRIDAVNADVRQEFDQGVEAGTLKKDQFDDFWSSYALPKMKQELLLNGDYKGAAALQEWGESSAAKKGSRLFAGALLKAQTGDMGGALDDAIAAGKVQGYIDHDFEIRSKEELVDGAGNVVGYRLHLSDGDGNEAEQDIALDDVPTVIATFANPAAAWESQRAAAAKKSERKAELDDYRSKKEIDAELEGGSKARSKAIEALRKQSEKALAGDPTFDTMDREEQEKAIADEIALQKGTAGAAPMPDPAMVVDGWKGVGLPPGGPATPNAAAPSVAAPGLGAVPDPGLNPGVPPQPTSAQLVKQAADMMVEGKDPNEIARMLKATGVHESQWPAGLINAVNPGGTARTTPAQ